MSDNSDSRLEALLKRARMLYNGDENNEFVNYLERLNSSAGTVIRPFNFCVDVMEMLMANTVNFNANNYYQTVKKIEKLYLDIFIYDENTPNIREVQLVFLELLEEDGVLAKNLFRLKLFLTFRDKNNYMYFMNSFIQEENPHMIMPDLEAYGIKARQYFIDDMEYCFHMIGVAANLINALQPERPGILDAELKKLEKMNGIYNIDSVDIARAEKQLSETRSLLTQGAEIINEADEKIRQLRMLEEELVFSIKGTLEREEGMMKAKASSIRENLQTEYETFIRSQENRVIFERQEFISKLFEESREELEKLKVTANAIASTTGKEIAKANKEAADIIEKAQKMVHDDDNIKKILQNNSDNQDIIDKINKLQILSDANIKAIENMVKAEVGKEESKEKDAGEAKEAETKTVVVKQNTADTAVVITDDEEEIIPPVARCLSEKISFKERFAEVMEEKKIREQLGEHYHEKFDDVLIAVMENVNPYLIGPSGCGKTFMVKQIAELLGLDYIDIGYINEEYDILGFQTANGGYSRPNFYRCYKYGKIAFCDELDNGNSKATVKLNSFLSNNSDGYYNFPNGEHVDRHDNFRIIAAGNTSGAGADENYSTREKIEESVQQRFLPIYIDYDNNVEKQILKDYPEWYDFCLLFREATSAFEKDSGTVAPGILTTRDAVKIKKYMDHKSFTNEKIICYEFVQTKDIDYLMFLDKYMQNNYQKYKKASGLLKIFSLQVKERSVNGYR